MTEPALSRESAPREAGYEIRYEPCGKRVRVEFNGVFIADSSRAIILHETRAPPMHYFPAEDVRMDLLERTQHQTHCPFKGNASYWSLKVAGKVAENAVWSYEDPYRDAEPIRGYLSFYRDKIAALYEGDEEVAFLHKSGDAVHGNPIAGWLIEEAWKAPTPEALMGQFCGFLRAAGYPIARSTVIIPTLHPQIFATVLVWRDDTADVRVVFEPHDILLQPRFADSPFAPIIRGAGGVRRHLEDANVKLDFPVVRDLRMDGATDYVAMPFRFSDGQINVISMTSFRKGGFSTSHLGSIYEIMPALGRLFEVHAQHRISVSLLETYLGRSTGKRVLDGQIKHGDGQLIHAVIWFCDLRDSTSLSERMGTAAYLAHLNRFFAAMAGSIIEHGGEILAYIGDAVLAIFPIADGDVPSRDGHGARRGLHAGDRGGAHGRRADRGGQRREPRTAGAAIRDRAPRRRRDLRQHRHPAAPAIHRHRSRRQRGVAHGGHDQGTGRAGPRLGEIRRALSRRARPEGRPPLKGVTGLHKLFALPPVPVS